MWRSFGIPKRKWTEARDKYERQREHKVEKTNSLSVYTEAHLQALSKENIIAAFQKTVLSSQMICWHPATHLLVKGFSLSHKPCARHGGYSSREKISENNGPEENSDRGSAGPSEQVRSS